MLVMPGWERREAVESSGAMSWTSTPTWREAAWAAMARGAAYYLWPFDQSEDGPDDEPLSARLVCSWCTTDADIDAFLAAARG